MFSTLLSDSERIWLAHFEYQIQEARPIIFLFYFLFEIAFFNFFFFFKKAISRVNALNKYPMDL